MTKIFKFRKKTFIFALLLIVFILCLMVANHLASLLITTDSKSEDVSCPEFVVYMLSLSKSKVKNEAVAISSDYQKMGAGGFVWEKDGYFHVVSSAYINKNDAELVKNSIKLNQNLDSEIFSVKFKSAKVSGSFSSEEKKVVAKALSSAQIFFTSIYDVAVSLDTGVYNEISAKLAVNEVTNRLATIYANFSTLYPSEVKNPMTETKNYVKAIAKLSHSLSADERPNKSQTYSSHLKYRYLEALDIYMKYLNPSA